MDTKNNKLKVLATTVMAGATALGLSTGIANAAWKPIDSFGTPAPPVEVVQTQTNTTAPPVASANTTTPAATAAPKVEAKPAVVTNDKFNIILPNGEVIDVEVPEYDKNRTGNIIDGLKTAIAKNEIVKNTYPQGLDLSKSSLGLSNGLSGQFEETKNVLIDNRNGRTDLYSIIFPTLVDKTPVTIDSKGVQGPVIPVPTTQSTPMATVPTVTLPSSVEANTTTTTGNGSTQLVPGVTLPSTPDKINPNSPLSARMQQLNAKVHGTAAATIDLSNPAAAAESMSAREPQVQAEELAPPKTIFDGYHISTGTTTFQFKLPDEMSRLDRTKTMSYEIEQILSGNPELQLDYNNIVVYSAGKEVPYNKASTPSGSLDKLIQALNMIENQPNGNSEITYLFVGMDDETIKNQMSLNRSLNEETRSMGADPLENIKVATGKPPVLTPEQQAVLAAAEAKRNISNTQEISTNLGSMGSGFNLYVVPTIEDGGSAYYTLTTGELAGVNIDANTNWTKVTKDIHNMNKKYSLEDIALMQLLDGQNSNSPKSLAAYSHVIATGGLTSENHGNIVDLIKNADLNSFQSNASCLDQEQCKSLTSYEIAKGAGSIGFRLAVAELAVNKYVKELKEQGISAGVDLMVYQKFGEMDTTAEMLQYLGFFTMPGHNSLNAKGTGYTNRNGATFFSNLEETILNSCVGDKGEVLGTAKDIANCAMTLGYNETLRYGGNL